MTEAHQLNRQLQSRIRELEKSPGSDASMTAPVTVIDRDSHNSKQPPSLDLPWIKPKRTGSLRKQSGLKIGGQIGHAGATLRLKVCKLSAGYDLICLQCENKAKAC